MRNTVIYILRLLVDETDPAVLRGILRDVASGEEHTFSGEQGLLDLLHPQPDGQPMTSCRPNYFMLEDET